MNKIYPVNHENPVILSKYVMTIMDLLSTQELRTNFDTLRARVDQLGRFL